MEITLVFTIGLLLALAAGVPAIALRQHLGRRLRQQTDQHQTALQRIESEAPDSMFTMDERGCIRSFNAAAERMFGYTAAEMMGRSIGTIIPIAAGGSTAGYGLDSLHTAKKTPNGIGLEVTGQRRNSTYIPLDLRLTEASEHGTRMFHALARDLTERQTAERNARDVQFLDGLLHSVGAPVLVLDKEGTVIRQNRAFEEMTGYSGEESRGRQYWELLLPQEEWSGTKVSVAQTIVSSGKDQGELVWRKRSGQALHVYAAMTAMRAGNAPAEHAVLVAFELPEARPAEMAGSLEAVERLAGGIAQQFNDLLTSINGYSELVLHTLDAGDPLRRDVEEIKRAGERATALTSQLLAFSRKQPMKTGIFHLNTLISGMKTMLGMLLGDRIHVSTVLDLELGTLKADQGWIEQVILNLAVNARDAMPEGGKLLIETAHVSLDAATARRTAQLAEGEYVLLTVSDTGCGIDPAARAHLFEPFYTTKRPGKGLGLGLSTVYGVVRQSGGNLVVQSIPGKGTSVRIYLPRHEETEEEDTTGRGLFLVRGASAGGH